jgi:hypothetical protein
MWDDSYDSYSSPEAAKSKGKGLYSKKSSNATSNKGFQKDLDMLFSPSGDSLPPSEANSPDERYEKRTYKDPYAFDDVNRAKPEHYLSNFAANSGDLEDSILGELLGGGSKKPPPVSTTTTTTITTSKDKVEKGGRKLSPAGKLEPLDTNTFSTVRSPRATSSPKLAALKSSSSSHGGGAATTTAASGRGINRFSNDGPLSSIRSVDFNDSIGGGNGGPPSLEGALPMTSSNSRAHFNSFDIDGGSNSQDANEDSTDSHGLASHPGGGYHHPSKPSSFHPTKTTDSINLATKRSTHALMKPEYSNNHPGIASTTSLDSIGNDPPPPSASATVNTQKERRDSIEKQGGGTGGDDEQGGEKLGFIPSFLDPSRQGRRRRNLDEGSGGPRPSTTGSMKSNMNKLDELDAALGLATAPLSVGNKVCLWLYHLFLPF